MIPAEVTGALEAMQDDALMVAGLVLACIVAVFALKFIMRMVVGMGPRAVVEKLYGDEGHF